MKYNCYLHPQRTLTLSKEEIPDTVDVSQVINRFSEHSYHAGKCTNKMTHVVRDVKLNDNGGFDVIFEFVHTLLGQELMEKYCNGFKLKVVPIVDQSGINITRFDLQPEG